MTPPNATAAERAGKELFLSAEIVNDLVAAVDDVRQLCVSEGNRWEGKHDATWRHWHARAGDMMTVGLALSALLAARRDADTARDAWMRVAAAWMVQAYGRGYGIGSDLMRWADETLGDSPFGDEPSGMTRAALATPATSHITGER